MPVILSNDRLSGIYGTILFDDLGTDQNGNPHQRNITVFADGEVDRSPCGSGTCSRVAALAAAGQLQPGETLIRLDCWHPLLRPNRQATHRRYGHPAVIPEVTGMAYRTANTASKSTPPTNSAPASSLR